MNDVTDEMFEAGARAIAKARGYDLAEERRMKGAGSSLSAGIVDECVEYSRAALSAALARKPVGDADKVRARLEHAIITATNDDLSKPGTSQRTRHIERTEAMRDAVELLRQFPAAPEPSPDNITVIATPRE